MDVIQLKNFQTIAKLEHLTKSAEHLNISQPALSASLARLEEELGVCLFDRVGRRIVLNECGHIFLEYVDLILHDIENAKIELHNFIEKSNKTITVYYTSKRNMEPIYTDFNQMYPNVMLRRFEISTTDIEKALQGYECDFVVASLCHDEDYGPNCEIIAQEPLQVVLSSNHPLANRKSISINELEGEPFISMPLGFSHRTMMDRLCLDAGFTCRVSQECFLCRFLFFVAKGIGITVTSESMLNESCNKEFLGDKIVFIPLTGLNTTLKTALIWSGNKKMTWEAKNFLEFIRRRV